MEILKEKKIVDNLIEKQTTYKKDIHEYVHFLKDNEIEKRSKCYMTDMFDMLCGSSTGGIVTALCTIPARPGSMKPFDSMSDIMVFT
jgi:hypothetical protein